MIQSLLNRLPELTNCFPPVYALFKYVSTASDDLNRRTIKGPYHEIFLWSLVKLRRHKDIHMKIVSKLHKPLLRLMLVLAFPLSL